MILNIKHICFILSFICHGAIFSQNYSFNEFSSDQLESRFIYNINQDSSGNLYLGTSNGLIKYDGVKFEPFTTENGLLDNFIDKVHLDGSTLWFSYYNGGFGFLRNDVITNVNEIEFVSNFSFVDSKTVVQTNNYEYIYENELVVNTTSSNTVKSDFLNNKVKVFLDKENNLHLADQLNDSLIQDIDFFTSDIKNNIIFTIKDSLLSVSLVKKNLVLENINQIDLSEFHLDLLSIQLSRNRFYLCSSNQGLLEFIFDESYQSFTTNSYKKSNGLSSNYIQTSYLDHENNLWFGTYGDGLSMLPYSRTSILQNEDNIGVNQIIKYDSKLILATNKGLYKLERHTLKIEKIVSDYYISSLHEINGNLLVGTKQHGLFLFRNDNLIPYNTFADEPPNTINCIRSDENSIYLGTNTGLFIITGNESHQITTNEGLAHNIIENFIIDSNRTFWFDSPNSPIYSYNDGEFKYFKNVPGFASFNITDIKEVATDEILIATAGDGLFQYTDDNFTQLSEYNGLYNNYIYFIEIISNDLIIVGHKKGISIIDKSISKINSIGNIDELEYILPTSNYFSGVNSLWIGASNGLVNIPSQTLINYEFNPIFKTESVIINKDTAADISNINLPYGNYFIDFNFKSIVLSNPTSVSYKYKLFGFDKNWTSTTYLENQARYQSLKDGDYRFVVKLFINKRYSGKKIVVNLTVAPPVWKTYWFYIVILFIIIIIVIIILKISNDKNIKLRKILANKVEERTATLNQRNIQLKQLSKDYLAEKHLAESQTKEIHRSLNYASRIQKGLFRRPEYAKWFNYFRGGFLIFKPKDKVSGDFYWGAKKEKDIYIGIGDCTGHGVPGAMLSILATSVLNEIIRSQSTPSELLDKLRERVIFELGNRKKTSTTEDILVTELYRDGMDIALIKIDTETLIAQSASAFNSVYIVRSKELPPVENAEIIKSDDLNILYATEPDKQPVGLYENMTSFNTAEYQLIKNDHVYLFSDGYQDQFGGEKNKKFLRKRFIQLLLSIHGTDCDEQKETLESTLKSWKGEREQVDDITVFGLII